MNYITAQEQSTTPLLSLDANGLLKTGHGFWRPVLTYREGVFSKAAPIPYRSKIRTTTSAAEHFHLSINVNKLSVNP